MALFVIADLHLSLGEDKPMDVFPGWKDYTKRLEENWRSVVREQDTVVIAGDSSWAMRLEDTKTDFSFLQSLPGQKILLKGNHDYWWSTASKINSFFQNAGLDSLHILHNNAYRVGEHVLCGTRGWLYNAATDEDKKIVAREAGRLRMSLAEGEKLGGEKIVFLHYPPLYDHMACQELLDILVEYQVRACYFGHIHGKDASEKALTGSWKGIQMSLISCDFVKFTPVLIR